MGPMNMGSMETDQASFPSTARLPTCEFIELANVGGVAAICARPAYGVIADAIGARHFACADHLAAVKAQHDCVAWAVRPSHSIARPFPEAMA
jgi:hypothetical protein